MTVLHIGSTASLFYAAQVKMNSGYVEVTTDNSDTDQTIRGNTQVATGEWHFIAATIGSGTMKIYIDGTNDGHNVTSGSDTGRWADDLDDVDGQTMLANYAAGVQNNSFDGKVADPVRVYKRRLTELEINECYTNELAAGGF